MSIDALIFDVDGTMADTEEAHRTAFNLAFERYRLGWVWSRAEYRELLKVTGGKERISHYIRSLTPVGPTEYKRLLALVPDLHAEKTRFYSSVVSDGAVPLRSGVERLLDEALAAGCRLAIASTTTAVNIDALLQTTLGTRGLGMFNVIACGDQVRAKKPAPDIYNLALHHLGLQANQAVAFEDSPNGLRSSVAAGLWTVVTPTFWTEGGDFSAAGLVLPELGEPAVPLAGEPGGQLRSAGWLTFEELMQKAAPQTTQSAVNALYQRGS
jgi:HAD superfamily hydrolase (TIGR01509 family)